MASKLHLNRDERVKCVLNSWELQDVWVRQYMGYKNTPPDTLMGLHNATKFSFIDDDIGVPLARLD